MKFIHTADWHLGKTLHGASLIDDQLYIIEEILKIADDEKADAIIIAGDIYDRGFPPVAAVNLFDEFLANVTERKIKLLCISGNHDSAARLNFGSKIFARSGIFFKTRPEENPAPIVLQDKFGDVCFSLIPYFEPGAIAAKFFPGDDEKRLSYDEANKIYIETAEKNIPAGKRKIAVAHVFITGETKTDSVREIVGGADGISAEHFKNFNYAALGHLHAPRNAGGEFIRYSGSPLKYSFDESEHKKSVSVVEIDGDGTAKINSIPLTPRRDVRQIEGTVEELLKFNRTDDYVKAVIKEDSAFMNVAERLSDVFPNLLSIERKMKKFDSEEISQDLQTLKGLSIPEQFAEFFREMTEEEISDEYKEAFEKFLTELKKE